MGWEADDEVTIPFLAQGTGGAVDPLAPYRWASHNLVTRRSKLIALINVLLRENNDYW